MEIEQPRHLSSEEQDALEQFDFEPHNCLCLVAGSCQGRKCECLCLRTPCSQACCPLCRAERQSQGRHDFLSQSSSEEERPQPKRQGQAGRAKGCNCASTRCLKNYCSCYSGGRGCGEQCRCRNCENRESSDEEPQPRRREFVFQIMPL